MQPAAEVGNAMANGIELDHGKIVCEKAIEF